MIAMWKNLYYNSNNCVPEIITKMLEKSYDRKETE